MNTIILSKQDVKDFINSQPDEREVNMDESTSIYLNKPTCGCLLIHLYKDRFKDDFSYIRAGINHARGDSFFIVNNFDNFDICEFLESEQTTYKELKKIVNEPNWV